MKHAFLIIAHNNFEILKYQLKILDEENSAFFIHIDKRAQIDKAELEACVKKSEIIFIPSKKIFWGHYSQVDCELRLIRTAGKRGFDYYHLISGVDMPLHTVKEMDQILQKKTSVEYIHFDASQVSTAEYDRIRYYHIMPGRENWKKIINGVGIKVQKLLGINRMKGKNITIQKGANWFTITDSLIQAVIREEPNIRKMLRWSFCGDEIFLQTYVYNSDFRNNLSTQHFNNDYSMCLRKIDWNRGNPYIYRSEDFQELITADELFARKFDEIVDIMIVKKIAAYLKAKKEGRMTKGDR